LRKDPDRRWQTMADLRVSLQELKEESESGRIAAPPPEHRMERRRSRWLAGALAVAVVLLAGAAWMLFHNRQPPAAPVVAWKPIPLTALPGRTGHPSFSTDGSQVAFVWDGEDGRPHVYIKLVGPGRPLRLTQGQANDWGPAWSPDGRFIAFYREITVDRFALMLVPALGGVERKVTEFDVQPYNLIGPAWFPDSASLVISARPPGSPRNSLQRISIETSEMVPLFEPPASATHGDDAPSIAPDGHALAFTRSTINSLGYLNVVPLTADGKAAGPPKQISTGTITIIYIAWAPDGRDLIVSSGRRGNMFRIPSDGTGPLVNLGLRDGSQQSVSARSNRLAYVEARLEINLWEADLNGSARVKGPLRRLTQAAGRKVNAQYSPDGKRIAFSSNRTGSQEIWVAEADGGNASPITSLGANVTGSPHWSPDGQKIAFDCNIRGGVYDVYVVSAEGGKPQPLTNKDSSFAPAWSADGRRIYFASNRTGRNEVWSMDPTGKDVKQITRNGGMGPQPSADGSTIYYSHGEGNTATLMKVPAAGGEEEKVLDGLYRYSFAPVAKGVYYLAATPKLSIRFLDFATGKSTEVLSGTDEQDLGLAVSADGRRILFSKVDQFESDLMLVENFR
jgi:Tol biopolymer transport system component